VDYLTLKALHVACVLVHVGGLFATSLTLAFLETPRQAARLAALRRLRVWDRFVTGPTLIALWGLGIYMAEVSGQFGAPWLSIKLVIVVALSALHGLLAGNLRKATADPARQVPGWIGYAPPGLAVSVAAIAVLAVAKPF